MTFSDLLSKIFGEYQAHIFGALLFLIRMYISFGKQLVSQQEQNKAQADDIKRIDQNIQTVMKESKDQGKSIAVIMTYLFGSRMRPPR